MADPATVLRQLGDHDYFYRLPPKSSRWDLLPSVRLLKLTLHQVRQLIKPIRSRRPLQHRRRGLRGHGSHVRCIRGGGEGGRGTAPHSRLPQPAGPAAPCRPESAALSAVAGPFRQPERPVCRSAGCVRPLRGQLSYPLSCPGALLRTGEPNGGGVPGSVPRTARSARAGVIHYRPLKSCSDPVSGRSRSARLRETSSRSSSPRKPWDSCLGSGPSVGRSPPTAHRCHPAAGSASMMPKVFPSGSLQ